MSGQGEARTSSYTDFDDKIDGVASHHRHLPNLDIVFNL